MIPANITEPDGDGFFQRLVQKEKRRGSPFSDIEIIEAFLQYIVRTVLDDCPEGDHEPLARLIVKAIYDFSAACDEGAADDTSIGIKLIPNADCFPDNTCQVAFDGHGGRDVVDLLASQVEAVLADVANRYLIAAIKKGDKEWLAPGISFSHLPPPTAFSLLELSELSEEQVDACREELPSEWCEALIARMRSLRICAASTTAETAMRAAIGASAAREESSETSHPKGR